PSLSSSPSRAVYRFVRPILYSLPRPPAPPRDLHSFPTRRSSDLATGVRRCERVGGAPLRGPLRGDVGSAQAARPAGGAWLIGREDGARWADGSATCWRCHLRWS